MPWSRFFKIQMSPNEEVRVFFERGREVMITFVRIPVALGIHVCMHTIWSPASELGYDVSSATAKYCMTCKTIAKPKCYRSNEIISCTLHPTKVAVLSSHWKPRTWIKFVSHELVGESSFASTLESLSSYFIRTHLLRDVEQPIWIDAWKLMMKCMQ